MSWNNNGSGPWGNPGGNKSGNQGGGSSGGGDGGGDGPPPHGPWGGGGGDQGGPFRGGGGPFGPGGPFPDLEAVIRRAQAFIRDLLPGGSGMGMGGFTILLAVVLVLWVASGIYRVQPDEQGIVLRFGAYKYWTAPGLRWHIPWPVEAVERPAVTRINRTEIGYRSGASGMVQSGSDVAGRDVLAES